MKKINFLFILFLLSGRLLCQTTLENNPTSLRWYQVNTEHFRVLYSKGFEDQAQRVANTLEYIHDPEARTIGTKPRKISIVLQNQSSISNAFVSITPRRSELYTMPSQNYNFLGTNDWLNLVASHEYRHIVQYQHANRGIDRMFYYLFGANTLALFSHLAVPEWFWEGDAVTTETAFTHSGRGRIPNFGLVFKTNLLEGRTFNYDKQYLRSYKNNIPDHYVLGYHLVSYLRKRTNDPEIWGKITARAWNVPFRPFTFSSAIKKETGLYVSDLYKAMVADLKKDWQAEIDKLQLTSFRTINTQKRKAYTDYLYPQPLDDGSLLVMKKGIGDIEKFCKLKNGHELKGYTPGFINDAGMLSVAQGKVAWSEYGYDPRWLVRNYSLIKVYDFNTKQKRIIGSRHARYAGASLSPDGTLVAAVRSDNNYKNALVVLSVATGRELKAFDNPDNVFFSMPRWSADGQHIVTVKTTPEGKTISSIQYQSGASTDLLPVARENMGYPVLYKSYLFFNSPVSGIDNIYALDIQSNKRYQVTTSKYGAYNPALSKDGRLIYYNEQTRNGLDVVEIPLEPSRWKEYIDNQNTLKPLSEYVTQQEGRSNIMDSIPQRVLPVKRYSKLNGMINPYSWGGYFTNTLAQANLGITSQDILSTTAINAGYQLDINERTGLWNAGISYQGFLPIIDANVTTGNRRLSTGVFDRNVKFTWHETGISTGLRIPLVLTHSKYYTNLEIGNSFGATKISSFRNEVSKDGVLISTGSERFVKANDTLIYVFNDRVSNGNLFFNKFTVSYSHSLKQSRRDFNPAFGQFIDFENYNTPYGGDFKGSLWVIRGSAYFPGLIKHHSLYFRGGYQSAFSSFNTDTYAFRNRLSKPRGYAYPQDSKFYSFSTNYALPLWYPDIHIGPFLNIQRIKANLFYDKGRGEGRSYFYDARNENKIYYRDNTNNYTSMGIELTFDINVIRVLPQFEIGVRGTYINTNRFANSGTIVEFIVGNIPF